MKTSHLYPEDGWDIDKLVGAIIDAYTLAPNDENEKREAIKATIQRSGWYKRLYDRKGQYSWGA